MKLATIDLRNNPLDVTAQISFFLTENILSKEIESFLLDWERYLKTILNYFVVL